MTVVFEREIEVPATHALIVGCGHFPKLPGAPAHDRPACPDSARRVVEFLMSVRDDIRIPIASISVLITEAGGGAGTVAKTDPAQDPRPDTIVEIANRQHLGKAGEIWIDRCRPGDHLFFYGCSHGVAERDGSAFLLLDDIRDSGKRPWENALNVHSLAKELPATTRAGACWIFVDACQELLDGVVDQIDGLGGWKLVNATASQLAMSRVRSVSLAAARFGGFAHAPPTGGAAHFTKALIDALGQNCVERTSQGWAVSAKEVLFGVSSIAEVAYGQLSVECEPLGVFTGDLYFRDVKNPEVPVLVTTQPSTLLRNGTNAQVTVKSSGANVKTAPLPSDTVWRFRVPVNDDYVISVDTPTAPVTKGFFAKPPAMVVEVKS